MEEPRDRAAGRFTGRFTDRATGGATGRDPADAVERLFGGAGTWLAQGDRP
ncbi:MULTISPECIES: hypothetical protein [Frankia]|uniref:hypothetical protein n=1 Tax=Frankia TaxID=1854 RepID=UPI0002F55D35|nr:MULTISPECIES: hypothetical protein [Frankia]